ncbi:TPA: molecular chaperone [Serratia marcescens]|uniref:fimbrial biogenesis chaperone n=1 Tax=Serratia marcescens TaxID=615 RepID=UPI000952218C|nr:molecular chaperone [Serratia marcescens]
MRISTTGLLIISLTVTAGACAAGHGEGGITLGGTRVVFDGSQESTSVPVTNTARQDVWLMRFWISPYDDPPASPSTAALPFAVTPPLYRLDPDSTVQLRINKIVDTLPADRESVFWLNNLAIPPKKGEKSLQKAVQSGLQFAVNTRIKLFYRPPALNDAAAVKTAPGRLIVVSQGKTLSVSNPTPWYLTLVQLSVNNTPVAVTQDTMVAPFGSLTFPVGVVHGVLRYHTVDDRGMTTDMQEKRF